MQAMVKEVTSVDAVVQSQKIELHIKDELEGF